MEIKFAERMKEMRKEIGLTQKELAEMLGVSQPAIARWESGEDRPSYEMLIELCKILKASFAELLGVDGI